MRFAIILAVLAAASLAWSGETTGRTADGGSSTNEWEWTPAREVVLKWEQLPDCNANPVSSEWCGNVDYFTNLADDFFCDDGIPIVAVEWWGERSDHPDCPLLDFFIVKFYEYLPAFPFGRPGAVLYDEAIYNWDVELTVGPGWSNWDWHYTAELPWPFDQEAQSYYFIQITASHNCVCAWSWAPCHVDYQWNGEAVLLSDNLDVYEWTPVSQVLGDHFESAFVLYGEVFNPVEQLSWSTIKSLYR